MRTKLPTPAELRERPEVRIVLLTGWATDGNGVARRAGDIFTVTGRQALGFLMAGTGDFAPEVTA